MRLSLPPFSLPPSFASFPLPFQLRLLVPISMMKPADGEERGRGRGHVTLRRRLDHDWCILLRPKSRTRDARDSEKKPRSAFDRPIESSRVGARIVVLL